MGNAPWRSGGPDTVQESTHGLPQHFRLIGKPGSPLAQETEVELDADYGLDYRYVIQAITAVSGRFDPVSREVIRYVDKVKFAPPRKPEGP